MSGAAYAQGVTVSGSAEMGVAGGSDSDAMFHQDVDVAFAMEGVTDAGLTFGTAVSLDDTKEDKKATTDANTTNGGFAVYVKGPFGNITLGDTDGGFDWALAEVNGAGSIADNETGHAGFDGNSGLDGNGGNDGQILRYDNSFGDLGVAVSFEQEDGGSNGDIIGVGVKGGFGDFAVGAGYQTHDGASVSGMSASATFGEISGTVNFSRMSPDMGDNTTHFGVGATYTVGATTVNVNYGQKDNGSAENNTGFGVAATYGLGGGATLKFGYGNSDHGYGDDAGTTSDAWSLGLGMSF